MNQTFFSILLGTFVLEDAALVSSIALVSAGKMSLFSGFLACFIGIALGDLGLYGLGYMSSQSRIANLLPFLKKYRGNYKNSKTSDNLSYWIVISRVIPGTRLPTYLAAGFLHYSFGKFAALTGASVFVWVLSTFFLGSSVSTLFKGHWILTVLALFVLLHLLKSWVPILLNKWDRRAHWHAWRKWTQFEFWPAWFFYLPVIPFYIYLSIKHRSFLMPFYASPGLAHGGLIGESKWDFLKYLSSSEPSSLLSVKISEDAALSEVEQIIENHRFQYPFILKPDVGQRGFGVRIIKNRDELKDYLSLSRFDRIIQKLSNLPMEAGLFYTRRPSDAKGSIFSVTDKKFPTVLGDGVSSLGELIMRDPRARIIAPVYFERHRLALDEIVVAGKVFYLSDCGNHCQGAIFLNGTHLITDALTSKLDQIAKQIPDFYFGRFDVRYASSEALKKGEQFEIVEVNGSGSEATHIWDSKTSLKDAYRTLFEQWSLLFEIGSQVSRLPGKKMRVNISAFLRECARVYTRKESLSVSS